MRHLLILVVNAINILPVVIGINSYFHDKTFPQSGGETVFSRQCFKLQLGGLNMQDWQTIQVLI